MRRARFCRSLLALSAIFFAVINIFVAGPFLTLAALPHYSIPNGIITTSLESILSIPRPTPLSEPVIRRRPIVYIYDWLGHCHALGLCANSTLAASRRLACEQRILASMLHEDSRHSANCEESVFGKTVNEEWGALTSITNHLSTPDIILQRLLNSQWRTLDPAQATLFYIPYDPFLDHYPTLAKLYRTSWHPYVVNLPLYSKDNETYAVAKLRWLLGDVVKSPWFTRRQGRDHFMATSFWQPLSRQQKDLLDEFLPHVTKLNSEPETSSLRKRDAIGRWQTFVASAKTRSVWAGVPYPSIFHPTALYDSALHDPCTGHEKKDVLIAMAFALSVVLPVPANQLRPLLYKACSELADSQCQALVIADHLNITEFFDKTVALYRRSKYCIVPPGDIYTSKRFFDAISCCCVPVLAGMTPSLWKKIYSFKAMRPLIAAVTPVFISEPRAKSTFRLLLRDNGIAFEKMVPIIRRVMPGLLYFTEDHPVLMDNVDRTVAVLADGIAATLAPVPLLRP